MLFLNGCYLLERYFPLAVFKKYWFHLEFNLGKHIISKRVPKELIPTVKKDIKMLLATLYEGEFKNYLTIVHTRWSNYPRIKSFQDYF